MDTHIAAGSQGAAVLRFADGQDHRAWPRTAPTALRAAARRDRVDARDGVATNLPFHAAVLGEPDFLAGGVDTELRGAAAGAAIPLRVEGATHG